MESKGTKEEKAKHYAENWEEITGLDWEDSIPLKVSELDYLAGYNQALEDCLFEEPTKLPSELLKEYFKNTPREQVLKDWESTSDYDNVNSPKVLELFEGGEKYELGGGLLHNPKSDNNGWIKIESEADLPKKEVDVHFIFTDKAGKYQTFGVWDNKLKSFYSGALRIDNVTHYQPIIKPLPPKS